MHTWNHWSQHHHAAFHLHTPISGRVLELAQDAGVLNVQWNTELCQFISKWHDVFNCKMEDAVALHYEFKISLDRLHQIDTPEQGATVLDNLRNLDKTLAEGL